MRIWPLQKARSLSCLAVGAAVALAGVAGAQETTVKNDSVVNGSTAAVQAGFVAGESAAVWLTSPCDGNIVAVQVFWRSLFGNTGQSIEDSITIYRDGPFPFPGAVAQELLGPVMTDGVLNEYRFLDENNTVPLMVPVTAGETFVVSFKFFNSPSPLVGPSVVTDTDGCQFGKNGIDCAFGICTGWTDSCTLGISGDFMIRAVVDCESGTLPGACCIFDGSCMNLSEQDCINANGVWNGAGTTCASFNCAGACCLPDGTCEDNLFQSECNNHVVGQGAWQGANSTCATSLCPQTGACCLPDGTCADAIEVSCTQSGGAYQGDNIDCAAVSCPQPMGACCFGTGSCLNLTEPDCTVAAGTFLGVGIACNGSSCPSGACCLPDGSCMEVDPLACSDAGGAYRGDDTTCATEMCPQPFGACCLSTGGCLNLIQTDCTLIPGASWAGAGTDCVSGVCNTSPTGACQVCVPGLAADSCTTETEADCSSLGGSYLGDGSDCGQAVACCPCDWDLNTTLNSDDFFGFLTDFFAGSADFNADTTTNSDDFFAFLNCFFDPGSSGC